MGGGAKQKPLARVLTQDQRYQQQELWPQGWGEKGGWKELGAGPRPEGSLGDGLGDGWEGKGQGAGRDHICPAGPCEDSGFSWVRWKPLEVSRTRSEWWPLAARLSQFLECEQGDQVGACRRGQGENPREIRSLDRTGSSG